MKKKLITLLFASLLICGCTKKADETAKNIKIDSSKPYIYAADYKLPTEKESYMGYSDGSVEIKASDIVVPYINIDSEDAKKVNDEIYGLYERLIEIFNSNSKYGTWFTTVEYDVSETDNDVTTLITTMSAGTSVPIYSYYAYTFSKKDGHLYTYKETYESLGYNDENILAKVSDIISKEVKNVTNEEIFDEYFRQSLDDYKQNVEQGKLKYFVDKNGKLNINLKIIVPLQDGYINKLVAIN